MKSLLYSSRKRRGSECESWGCPGSSATPQLGDLGRVTRLVSSLGKWEKNESSLLSGMFWVVHKIRQVRGQEQGQALGEEVNDA